MVSNVTSSNSSTLSTVADTKAGHDEKLVNTAATALKNNEKRESSIKLRKVKDLSLDVKTAVLKSRLQEETTTSTKRKIIVLAVLVSIVFLAALPWVFPMLFADVFAWQIASILFAGSILPIGLVVGWKLTYGETPKKTLLNQMQNALNTKGKLKKYAEDVRAIVINYDVEKNVDSKKAFLDLLVDPALYDLLRNAKHEGRKKLDEALKHVEKLDKKVEDLLDDDQKTKELEEARSNLEDGKKSVRAQRAALKDEEEEILKKHGFIVENESEEATKT